MACMLSALFHRALISYKVYCKTALIRDFWTTTIFWPLFVVRYARFEVEKPVLTLYLSYWAFQLCKRCFFSQLVLKFYHRNRRKIWEEKWIFCIEKVEMNEVEIIYTYLVFYQLCIITEVMCVMSVCCGQDLRWESWAVKPFLEIWIDDTKYLEGK